jgi:hypothetical protein
MRMIAVAEGELIQTRHLGAEGGWFCGRDAHGIFS